MHPVSLNIGLFILEDEIDTHEALLEMIKEKNLPSITNVRITHNPVEYRKNLNSDINICAIDHTLGYGVSGLDMVRETKMKNSDSFVFAVTGQQDYRVVIEYLNAGTDAYVDKNIKGWEEEFIKTIERGLTIAEGRITALSERQAFKDEMKNRMKNTAEMINKLENKHQERDTTNANSIHSQSERSRS